MSFRVLGRVHPVSYAVINTFKRIAIVLGAANLLEYTPELNCVIGCLLSVISTLMYALVMSCCGKRSRTIVVMTVVAVAVAMICSIMVIV
jgi:hypothetical protein